MTGLDGNYRITCHTVMEVLREHRDSVMAVLEAFVYDPLLNWRLMDSKMIDFALITIPASDDNRYRQDAAQEITRAKPVASCRPGFSFLMWTAVQCSF